MFIDLIYKDQSIVLIKYNTKRTIMSISAERERERRGGGQWAVYYTILKVLY